MSFSGPPTTAAQADQQIKALLAIPRYRGDLIEERDELQESFERWGGSCAVRDEEIEGYGSAARWASQTLDQGCS